MKTKPPQPTTTSAETCAKCKGMFEYHGTKRPKRKITNWITGRSITGGFICMACYVQGETFDWRDRAIQDYEQAHKNDDHGAALRISRQVAAGTATAADRSDLLKFLKATLGNVGRSEVTQ